MLVMLAEALHRCPHPRLLDEARQCDRMERPRYWQTAKLACLRSFLHDLCHLFHVHIAILVSVGAFDEVILPTVSTARTS